jgi:predicted RNase H-like HicB family nuclease
MKLYHVDVTEDDGWFVGRVLERDGVTTQGRTLDELVFMIRDAISLMWGEDGVQLELIIPGFVSDAKEVRRRCVPSKVGSKISKPGKARRAIVS